MPDEESRAFRSFNECNLRAVWRNAVVGGPLAGVVLSFFVTVCIGGTECQIVSVFFGLCPLEEDPVAVGGKLRSPAVF